MRCFDLPPHTSTLDLKRKYVLRKKLFRVGGYFVSGQAAAERRLLELFKELINGECPSSQTIILLSMLVIALRISTLEKKLF